MRSVLSSLAFSLAFAAPSVALAAPIGDGTGIRGFAEAVLDFLTNVIGPVAVGIGIAVAALSLMFGSRDGIQRAVYVIVAGMLLFAAGRIGEWVQAAAGGY